MNPKVDAPARKDGADGSATSAEQRALLAVYRLLLSLAEEESDDTAGDSSGTPGCRPSMNREMKDVTAD